MDTVQTTLEDLTQQITILQEQAVASAELAREIREQHQRLLSWSDMFDSASPQEKKIIASYIIKAVTLTRDYGIQVEFNISEAQYLGGMEMDDKCPFRRFWVARRKAAPVQTELLLNHYLE